MFAKTFQICHTKQLNTKKLFTISCPNTPIEFKPHVCQDFDSSYKTEMYGAYSKKQAIWWLVSQNKHSRITMDFIFKEAVKSLEHVKSKQFSLLTRQTI